MMRRECVLNAGLQLDTPLFRQFSKKNEMKINLQNNREFLIGNVIN